MYTKRTRMMTGRLLFSLALLTLALGSGRARASGSDETIKKTTGSYQSAKRTINVVRFEPASPGPHPAILLLHGIDGAATNEKMYHLLANRIAAEGYVVFFVHYFDCFADKSDEFAFFEANVKQYLQTNAGPKRERLEHGFQECLATVSDGVKYVRIQPGVDGERMGLVGFSLGAFLSLSAATEEDLKITAVVELSGGLPEELHKKATVLPPVLILHGDKDQMVSVEFAQRLQKKLNEDKTACEIKVYSGVGHVFECENVLVRGYALVDAEIRATAFLQKHLKAPASNAPASR